LAQTAAAGAFASLGLTRRAALWQAEAAARRGKGLFARVEPGDGSSPLPEMELRDRIAADLRGTGLTVGPHPVALERARLSRLGIQPAGALPGLPAGRRVRAGGLCIVRQRPGTAKGFVFLSLEDETGIANIVIDPQTFEANRAAVLASALLIVEGRLEQADGVTSLKADRFWPMHDALFSNQDKLEDGKTYIPGEGYHTDHSNDREPPKATALHASTASAATA